MAGACLLRCRLVQCKKPSNISPGSYRLLTDSRSPKPWQTHTSLLHPFPHGSCQDKHSSDVCSLFIVHLWSFRDPLRFLAAFRRELAPHQKQLMAGIDLEDVVAQYATELELEAPFKAAPEVATAATTAPADAAVRLKAGA